ncbi:helix-turn-helix domain-containing protein [Flavobacterium sp. N1736]|uniref:helix-turn-helix domain-containing protein n=1 Tax=Flavobacterium sp. N1736 TaxID=2986823 RepID=UPI002225A234|nr:helix-turn-helix transcriptional regulator [Flavobacterium sp. N1736]
MRTNNRIIKIIDVKFPEISFISRNGEHRILNLKKYFKKINLDKNDFGYKLIEDKNLFSSVVLEDNALAWKNLIQKLTLPSGKAFESFFHLDPINTIKYSDLIEIKPYLTIGSKVKYLRLQQKLSQEDLGKRIGSNKHYISKVENSKTDLELKTLQKIAEVGLNKNIYIGLYDSTDKLTSLSNSFLKPQFINWINSKKDDLTLIEGIDRKVCRYFLAENIISPTQLSTINLARLIDILTKNKESISLYDNADSWRIQAKYIANSEWANLIMLQKTVGSNHSKIEDLAKKELKEDIFAIQ